MGSEPPQRDAVDLSLLVRWVGANWQGRAREEGISLQVAAPDEAVTVMGDIDMLQQVLHELLDNALKFSPRGGRVHVRLWEEEGQARVSVRDEGVGIPPDVLPHLFQHFLQVNGGLNRRVGGMGIGLALCRKVVEAHGGRIWAESAGEGRGATFHVVLPLPAQGAPLTSAGSSTATTG